MGSIGNSIPREMPVELACIFTERVSASLPAVNLPNPIADAHLQPRELYRWQQAGITWQTIWQRYQSPLKATKPFNKWKYTMLSRIHRWRDSNFVLDHTPQSDGAAFNANCAEVMLRFTEEQLYFGVLGNIDLSSMTFTPPLDLSNSAHQNYAAALSTRPSYSLPTPQDVPAWFRDKVIMSSTFATYLRNSLLVTARWPTLAQVAPPITTLAPPTGSVAQATATSAPSQLPNHQQIATTVPGMMPPSTLPVPNSRSQPSSISPSTAGPSTLPSNATVSQSVSSKGKSKAIMGAPPQRHFTTNSLAPKDDASSADIDDDDHVDEAPESAELPEVLEEFQVVTEDFLSAVEEARAVERLFKTVRSETYHAKGLRIREVNVKAAKKHFYWPVDDVSPHEYFDVEEDREARELGIEGIDVSEDRSMELNDEEETEMSVTDTAMPGVGLLLNDPEVELLYLALA